mgnify:CR=1 FL=1
MEQLAVFYDFIQKSVDHPVPDNIVAQELEPEVQELLQDR